MQKFLLAFITSSLFLFGCTRDLIPRTDVLVVDPTMTCYNETLDDQEVGLDCGGYCKECENHTPICTSENNQLIFNNSTYELTNGTFDNNQRAIFKAYFNNGDSYITVNLYDFDPSIIFPMEENNYDSAFVQIYHTIDTHPSFSLATLKGGAIYAHDANGKRQITICGGFYWSSATQRKYYLDTLKLTIN